MMIPNVTWLGLAAHRSRRPGARTEAARRAAGLPAVAASAAGIAASVAGTATRGAAPWPTRCGAPGWPAARATAGAAGTGGDNRGRLTAITPEGAVGLAQ